MKVAVACVRMYQLGGRPIGGEPFVLAGEHGTDWYDYEDIITKRPPDGGLWVWEGLDDGTGAWRRPRTLELNALLVGDDPWEAE